MKNRYYITIIIALLTLTSCQKEEPYDGPCNVTFNAYMQEAVSVTRSGRYTEIPAGHPVFTAGLIVSANTLSNISAMTYNGTNLSLSLRLEEGDYWVYGYMPWRDNATLDRTGDKATMTIPALPAISSMEAMVIKPQLLQVGKADEQTVALKMDHLTAKIVPCFYLDGTYATMRTIKIKKVEFLLADATTHTATITYDNTVPSYTVAFTDDATPGDTVAVAYPTATYDTLTTTKYEQLYGACYVCPNQSLTNLKVRVTYDVMDKQGEVTRPDAVVENKIKRFATPLTAGTEYRLAIRIVPTYLYALSDNDEESVLIID
ncbi:MAG: hypothetical protein IJE15_08580 [Bacteroidaceae bacterium]|nr:hypothetical protein [Bacteroidaceae bacterium]